MFSPVDKGDPFTPGGSDRKLTRNLKRKYDAEHHVQKVGKPDAPEFVILYGAPNSNPFDL